MSYDVLSEDQLKHDFVRFPMILYYDIFKLFDPPGTQKPQECHTNIHSTYVRRYSIEQIELRILCPTANII